MTVLLCDVPLRIHRRGMGRNRCTLLPRHREATGQSPKPKLVIARLDRATIPFRYRQTRRSGLAPLLTPSSVHEQAIVVGDAERVSRLLRMRVPAARAAPSLIR